jgi:hypothetical protein
LEISPSELDPVSALAVAASAVQFLEFTSSLIRGTHEIYKSASGCSVDSVDLQTTNTSLKILNTDLRLSLDRVPSGKEFSNSNAELKKVCTDCNVVADQLVTALEQFKAQKTHNI